MTVITVPLPDYQVRTEPDHRRIGRRVDEAIRTHFAGHKIIARGVSADDHPDLTVDQLISIILHTGTDRYDPGRAGDRYDNVEAKHIDLFGFRRTVTRRMRLFEQLSWGFYHGSIEIHGRPTRLDVVTIYDATRLRAVLHRYAGRVDAKRDGYRFVEPGRQADAVLGVIKLGRV
ncbi:hypothetical protein [Microlunatus sp. Gsoil 973]|uniref:hypothetical protein n=1 Tax=Microlunatus sp. Gsoil 973 TaxID=2672569 RepID=UPI0018A7F534|nr:hypothetical protein [Microlunatus sp. Gsoil 973]